MLDLKERKKHRRVCDETLQKQKHVEEEDVRRKKRTPKAVDEDLYKIPPELLYKQSKRVINNHFHPLIIKYIYSQF